MAMSPKLLVVFDATGQQGGSVISSVLSDPELSKQYRIRAITRDTTSPAATTLQKKGVEVIAADLHDPPSIHTALHSAHTVFFLTAPAPTKDAEVTQGKQFMDIAVSSGVSYMIFSTLPHITTISGGRYTKVAIFDAKAEIEAYTRTLPLKSAFFAPGSFMQNWQNIMLPRPKTDGTYVIARHVSPETELPLIDTVADTGKYVGAILADPEKYAGKRFCAATALYSMTEMVQIISRCSGKKVVYEQIPEEVFRENLPVPQGYKDQLVEMMLYQQDFGYYGPDTKELVAWAAGNARGRLNTLEDYLRENPLPLK